MAETEVLVTGTFNVVHAGHVRLLEFASRYGLVTVGINSDEYMQEKYGDLAVSLVDRSYVLRNNIFVHKVVMFRETEPSGLVRKRRPNYYVKGPDYLDEKLPEELAISEVGGKLIIQRVDKEYNSSDLIKTLPDSAFTRLSKYT